MGEDEVQFHEFFTSAVKNIFTPTLQTQTVRPFETSEGFKQN